MTPSSCRFFFFNDTATTEIYTLSLHDALPICGTDALRRDASHDAGAAGHVEHALAHRHSGRFHQQRRPGAEDVPGETTLDRKSTRLNSSHSQISYAVFCLKKKRNPSDQSDLYE